MRPQTRAWAVPAMAVLTAMTALAGCQRQQPASVGEITEATYSQQQAIQGFDDGEYTTTDAEQLGQLQEVLEAHDLAGDVTLGEQCDGGRTTHVEYTSTSGTFTIDLEGCEGGEESHAIEEVVAGWHDRHSS